MDNSPLARLPRELRDQIYELVLSSNRTLIADLSRRTRYPYGPLMHVYGQLMRVCRQLRAEALPIFYSCNRFWFESGGGTMNQLLARKLAANLRALGPQIVCQVHRFSVIENGKTVNIESGMGKGGVVGLDDADIVDVGAYDTLLPLPITAAYRDMGLVLHYRGMVTSRSSPRSTRTLVVTLGAGRWVRLC